MPAPKNKNKSKSNISKNDIKFLQPDKNEYPNNANSPPSEYKTIYTPGKGGDIVSNLGFDTYRYGTPIAKFFDPTGISSYGDVYNTWNDKKFDYNDILQPLSALPLVGTPGKIINGIPKIGKYIPKIEKAASSFDLLKSEYDNSKLAYGGEINNNEVMNKSKYKSKYKSKKEQLPQFGWGGIGQAIGTGLGALLAIPTGGMSLAAGAALGSSLGGAGGSIIDSVTGGENTQGNQVQMPQLNIDPVNTQQYYNPVKAYGGGIPPTFEQYYKSVPKGKNDTTSYNLRRAYELAPKQDLERFISDKNAHLNSVYENKNTGEYEFMKSKNHPTIQKELDWYNSNNPEAIKFRNQYKLDTTGDYYKYKQKLQFPGTNYAMGGYMQPNAEVEGDEVIQYQPGMQPQAQGQGNMQQIASDMSVAKGPTHANGGVPISAAPGSMVVSNRLPAPNTKEYKSIANKVEMLGRKKGQLEKKIEKNPNDKIAKDTIGLVQKQIDTLIQQQEQMKVQNSQAIMAKAYQKAFGGTVTGNERLDKDFLNMWNTGSYAYGGGIPPYNGSLELDSSDGHKNHSTIYNRKSYTFPGGISLTDEYRDTLRSDDEKMAFDKLKNQYISEREFNVSPLKSKQGYINRIPTNNNINLPVGDEYAYTKMITPDKSNVNKNFVMQDPNSGGVELDPFTNSQVNWNEITRPNQTVNLPKDNGIKMSEYGLRNENNPNSSEKANKGKVPLKGNTFGNNLQYAAQYIPDIIASFTKKDKPIDPNMYMNQSRVNAARYDTSAEEAAVQDARNQAMLLAKETSGGDAGMYANLGNVANTGAYKNLGQVYNRAQNINMQNQMAADQANAGIEGQNRSMALNIANMNQADASAVEDRRMAGMQGIANKLANQYSQDRQFKLLKDIAPHYNYNEKNGELTFNGKKYYGEEAKTLLEQLKMNASNAFNKVLGFGQNIFGGI